MTKAELYALLDELAVRHNSPAVANFIRSLKNSIGHRWKTPKSTESTVVFRRENGDLVLRKRP